MKYLLFSILFLSTTVGDIFAQNASDYFPTQLDYNWFFEIKMLDSLNNPVSGSSRFRRDTYTGEETFIGRLAKVVHEHDYLSNPIEPGVVTDTARFSLEGSNAYEYISFTGSLDTLPFIGKLGITNFLKSLNNWYSVYRFSSNVNVEYTLFSKDTTITIDTLTLPIRFSYKAKRLNDEQVNTVVGVYNAKKFLLYNTISYLLIINPLPPIEIPIVKQYDTTWFAENIWLIKRSVPSTIVDLSKLGIPVSFFIPGYLLEVTNSSQVKTISNEIPDGLWLRQNYPNPFNPVTVINFSVPESGNVKLTLYDMNGREIAKLINGDFRIGEYSYTLDASGLASGVYVYKLETNGFALSKYMVLLK